MGRRTLLTHSFIWSGAALLLGLFPHAPAPVVMTLFSAYAILIGGHQVLQWIHPNELFPTEERGIAVGLASSLSRISAAGTVASLAWAPETRGLTLQQSAALKDPAGPIRQPVAR
ncbi:hypothetical protein [Streptomyces sp. NPDC001661]